MKIELGKRDAWYFGFLIVVILGIGLTIAYNSGGPASDVGHSVDEIDWSDEIPTINVGEICLNGSCITSWGEVEGSGSVTANTQVNGSVTGGGYVSGMGCGALWGDAICDTSGYVWTDYLICPSDSYKTYVGYTYRRTGTSDLMVDGMFFLCIKE